MAAPVGGPLEGALLRWGEGVGFAGAVDAGAFDGDAELPAVLVEQGDGGQCLVDRRGAGLALEQVPPPPG